MRRSSALLQEARSGGGTRSLLPRLDSSRTRVMDETTETPTTVLSKAEKMASDAKVDSGDEEEMLDWSKLAPKPSRASRSLPKKGEKSFEPIAMGPSAYQKFTLEKARQAMYDALSTPREIQTKRLSQAIWMPQYARAQVIDSRGTAFATLGYTVRRQEYTEKRLELLPEEALYLVERGSMLCWKQTSNVPECPGDDEKDAIRLVGEPMSVQQCFMSMLGVEGITIEHYSVYAHLKRFGYTVRRAQPLSSSKEYAVYQHPQPRATPLTSFAQFLSGIWRKAGTFFEGNWFYRFRPSIASYFGREVHFPSIFKSFRVISTKLPYAPPRTTSSSPYKVFFHVWKPETPWSRALPTKPDFDIVVINARTTPVPSIYELAALYETLPLTTSLALPPGAQRNSSPLRLLGSLLSWIYSFLWPATQRASNAFSALKAGKKSVVFAVVDAGTMTMYRFNEGCFDEWPMI